MSPTHPLSAPIERSWSNTVFFLGFGVLLLVVAFFLFQAEHEVWSLLVGFIGALLAYGAIFGSGTATCPQCNTRMFQLASGTREGCTGCGTWYDVSGSGLVEIGEERLSDTHEFAAPLPDSWVMPDLCCACGEPAAREEEISIQLSYPSESAPGLMRDLVTHGVHVPHCARHTGGAKLDRQTPKEEINVDTLAGTTGPLVPVTVLKVQSYKFYLAFTLMNKCFPNSRNKEVASGSDS